MSKIINVSSFGRRSYSGLTPATFAQTHANYPALYHLFSCNETTGSSTITDSIGGVVVGTAGTVTNNSDGTITSTAAYAGSNSLSKGTFTPPGTKSIMMISIGKVNSGLTNLFTAGKTGNNENGFGMGGAQSTKAAINSGGTTKTATINNTAGIAAPGQMEARIITFDLGSTLGITRYTASSTGIVTISAQDTLASHTAITTMSSNGNVFVANYPVGMLALLYWNTLPSVVETSVAAAWMLNRATVDTRYHKMIWPGWAGKQ